ncbi:MAG TPA: metal ABC transporter permease [Anaeromyxobacteraceae bacterium]|nr:metal ABC transporter permease [Anaeromyxobacteraceae bacterium]
MSAWQDFLAAKEIWREPLAASLLAGALCGFLGVYVVLRRTVFVSAALTQLSTFGLITALILEESLGVEVERASVQLAVAIAFSVVGALVLGTALHGRRLPAETPVGATYVIAGALVVLGANRLVHAAHDLNAMVFGNAVAVPLADLVVLAVVVAFCAVVHARFRKELVFVSFDGETAAALGYRVQLWNGLLFFTLGLAVPVAARALGALPVFAFLTLPAAGALLTARRLGGAFALATLVGAAAAGAGYLASWFWQTPTGATMVALAALAALPGAVLARVRGG